MRSSRQRYLDLTSEVERKASRNTVDAMPCYSPELFVTVIDRGAAGWSSAEKIEVRQMSTAVNDGHRCHEHWRLLSSDQSIRRGWQATVHWPVRWARSLLVLRMMERVIRGTNWRVERDSGG